MGRQTEVKYIIYQLNEELRVSHWRGLPNNFFSYREDKTFLWLISTRKEKKRKKEGKTKIRKKQRSNL